MKSNRISSLDGLKVIFCIILFLHHYWGGVTNYGSYGEAPFQNILGHIYLRGAYGVEFFFIVSGFLMTYTYWDRIEGIGFFHFILKRMKRIYPMMVISVIIGYILSCINEVKGYNIILVSKPIRIKNLILSLLCVNNGWISNDFNAYGSGTWFLNILLLCYIIWFVIIKRIRDKRVFLYVCLAMMALGWICKQGYFEFPFLYITSGRGYFNFFLGCILCVVYWSGRKEYALVSCIVGLTIGIALKSWDFIFSSFVCSTLIFIVLYSKFISRLLSNDFFSKFCKLTMNIYLTHVLIITIFLMLDKNYNLNIRFDSCICLAFIFFVSVLVSILLNRMLELLYNKLMARYRTRYN